MDRKLPELNAHNIFLVRCIVVFTQVLIKQAEEYKSSFDDIFKRKSMPRDPSFYVNVPSRIDPTAAPDGKDSIVVLIPVGHLVDGQDAAVVDGKLTQDWDAMVERAREQVVHTMEARLNVKGLREMIVWEEVNTPLTCGCFIIRD